MTRWDYEELRELVHTLRSTEPNAPTLCEGWQARHLLAHLYLRRHKPWQLLGRGSGSHLARIADLAQTGPGYAATIGDFYAPPRRHTPMGVFDGPFGQVGNVLEYLIHHEDIRRAAEPADLEPLERPTAQGDAVLDRLFSIGAMLTRKVPVGVVLVEPGGRRKVVRKGAHSVALVGEPVELALALFGRVAVAQIEIKGDPSAVQAATTALGGGQRTS